MRFLVIGAGLLLGSAAFAQQPAPVSKQDPSPPVMDSSEPASPNIPILVLPTLPTVLDWTPGVGEPDGMVSDQQAANERLPRHVYLERVLDNGEEIDVHWEVKPTGVYPAMPNLFGGDYPSGTLKMIKGQRNADLVIQTYETKIPDWHRDFEVTLTNARTGQPILGPFMTPIEINFRVTGDLVCAPGRPDLCDDQGEEEGESEGEDAPPTPKKP